MVFGFLTQAAALAVGALYPAYKTVKALRSSDAGELTNWTQYWTVFAAFLGIDAVAELFFVPYIVPFYGFAKVGFLLWAVNPFTHGSDVVYKQLMLPLVEAHEGEIDRKWKYLTYRVRSSIEGSVGRLCSRVFASLIGGAGTSPRCFQMEMQAEEDFLQRQMNMLGPSGTHGRPALVDAQPEYDFMTPLNNSGATAIGSFPAVGNVAQREDFVDAIAAVDEQDEADPNKPKQAARRGRKPKKVNAVVKTEISEETEKVVRGSRRKRGVMPSRSTSRSRTRLN